MEGFRVDIVMNGTYRSVLGCGVRVLGSCDVNSLSVTYKSYENAKRHAYGQSNDVLYPTPQGA